MKHWATTIAILPLLSPSLVLAEDFKTVSGRVYKDATISRVEADGIVLRTKTGISKAGIAIVAIVLFAIVWRRFK